MATDLDRGDPSRRERRSSPPLFRHAYEKLYEPVDRIPYVPGRARLADRPIFRYLPWKNRSKMISYSSDSRRCSRSAICTSSSSPALDGMSDPGEVATSRCAAIYESAQAAAGSARGS